jgi:choline dehydrogenase-like flavoprotein
MLDNTLPRAQRQFGEQAVRVLAECEARRIEVDGGRAHAVQCRLSDGRSVRIGARTVVVSAGALGSPLLLARSGIAGDQVGRRLGFNVATPLSADFDEELHSERGLQISHFLEPPRGHGFALETWFNPVVFQSLVMPGWFEQHTANMRRYTHMTCVGVVVGSRASATVKPRPRLLGGGIALDYAPSRDDVRRLVEGVKLAGRIMLAAGALRVMPLTFAYTEFASSEELDRLDELVRDDSDLSMNSAHPQGGCTLSRHRDRGVVNPEFRVHGFENLHVCDASVFPSPITLNPQLTVMALAHYAAAHVQ